MNHFFLDVDGCLLDEKYDINMDLAVFRKEIGNAYENDCVFHINSNRSLDSLRKIRGMFGLNGKIISENGICFYDPIRGELRTGRAFSLFKRDKLVRLLAESNGEVLFTDTDKLPKTPEDLGMTSRKEGRVFFCEQGRKYTMTVYPREIRMNSFHCTDDLLNPTAVLLAEFFQEYKVEVGEKYGNILLVPHHADKGALIPQIAGRGIIYAFGDGEADVSMFRRAHVCGAPANASERVKDEVRSLDGRISSRAYTAGVHEFITSAIS